MSEEATFILSLLAVVIAFAGLLVASWATHGLWYWVGLGVFVASVLMIFLLIRLTVGRPPASPEGEAPPGQ